MRDLQISIRQLAKTPGFSLAAIAVLALGIGLNAAMFSLMHSLVFASRPFSAPDRLVQLYDRDTRSTDGDGGYRAFSLPLYEQLAARADLFSGVLAHNLTVVGVGDGAESRRTFSALVSANYFDVLGVPLLAGRGFTAAESRPGENTPVVIASYAYWKRTGFQPALIGSTVRINERSFTIVGVTPPGFTGTMTVFGPELFFPLGVFHTLSNDLQEEAGRTLARADAYNLFLVGRLADGVPIAAASEALTLFGRGLAANDADRQDRALAMMPLPRFGTSTSPSDERVLTTLAVVLLGMTGAVLLTVCLNLASMLTARGRGRRKEFAVRLALGGSRARIVRQLLVEASLLSLIGGALGLALGDAAIARLVTTLSAMLPISVVLEEAGSPALIAATVGICGLATLAFALGPALEQSRADILSNLKAQAGDEPAPRGWRLLPRNPLVAAQVALSLSLLIAAGLFLRMALGAGSTDLGYDAAPTVLAEVDGRLGGLDEARSLALYARIEERLAALPGVQTASVGALVPMGTTSISKSVQRAGVTPAPGSAPATAEAGRAFSTPWNAIGASYFDAVGVRMLQGRRFSTAETYGHGAPAVAIVDETLAARLWPDDAALGQRIRWAAEDGRPAGVPMEIVGIVAPVRRELFERTPRGAVYVPLGQGFVSNVFFHVRAAGAAEALVDAVRRELRAAAPGVPLFGVRTFTAHVDNAPESWSLRASVSTFAAFGGLALVVALVGIYAVTAHAVVRRTREIGVRIAIGARPWHVLAAILRDSAATTLAGVAAGWLLGLGLGRAMASLFVDLQPFDAWTFTLVPAGFVIAALAATVIPARRATRVDPMTALRSE